MVYVEISDFFDERQPRYDHSKNDLKYTPSGAILEWFWGGAPAAPREGLGSNSIWLWTYPMGTWSPMIPKQSYQIWPFPATVWGTHGSRLKRESCKVPFWPSFWAVSVLLISPSPTFWPRDFLSDRTSLVFSDCHPGGYGWVPLQRWNHLDTNCWAPPGSLSNPIFTRSLKKHILNHHSNDIYSPFIWCVCLCKSKGCQKESHLTISHCFESLQ